MDDKDKKVLFDLMQTELEDALINMGGGEFDYFNSPENINKIISEIESKFNITLKQNN